MTTFTKEQLIARINQVTAINKFRISRDPDAEGLVMDNELFAIALASLEAEPVEWRVAFTLDGHSGSDFEKTFESQAKMNEVISLHERAGFSASVTPLYTAPPAPVVPDEIVDHRDAFEAVFPIPLHVERCGAGYCCTAYNAWEGHKFVNRWEGWNACRAAMQGKSEPVNQPYKLPDGWVACSERMPHIGVPVITCCGDVVQYAAYAWDGKEWQDWYEEYDKLPVSTFTHWHSRPTAPKQEM